TSTDTRGSSCCWTDRPRLQSEARTPHPASSAGSKLLVRIFWPKLKFDNWPQKSPPVARVSLASGFERSQSGWKFPFASVHARVTPAGPKIVSELGALRLGFEWT